MIQQNYFAVMIEKIVHLYYSSKIHLDQRNAVKAYCFKQTLHFPDI